MLNKTFLLFGNFKNISSIIFEDNWVKNPFPQIPGLSLIQWWNMNNVILWTWYSWILWYITTRFSYFSFIYLSYFWKYIYEKSLLFASPPPTLAGLSLSQCFLLVKMNYSDRLKILKDHDSEHCRRVCEAWWGLLCLSFMAEEFFSTALAWCLTGNLLTLLVSSFLWDLISYMDG